ncbi:MAG: hypothetical protein HC848_09810 [Limnobacter sp.]|nr:hypothetical protein [Limnobacter sp.]
MKADGLWRYGAGLQQQQTDIAFTLQMADVGGFLQRFGMQDVFKGGQAKASGKLNWDGAPTAMHYPSLSGNVAVSSTKGRFLKADPGVAKLLGVLSLQGVARRLTLDFNDLFLEGFAYDKLDADVTLKLGVASTPNFKMVGPSASVAMDGTLDIAAETQNLNVVVLPDLNATGGSLIYSVVAANPAVGIASLLADYILKDPLSKIFSLQYKVTGPWDNPKIERIQRQVQEQAGGRE